MYNLYYFFIFRAYVRKIHVWEDGKDTFEPGQCASRVFDSLKFISGCRISIVSVTPKKAKIVPFYENGGILHLSYLLNESGDPDFLLLFFTMCISWNSTLESLSKFSFLEQLLMNYLNCMKCPEYTGCMCV